MILENAGIASQMQMPVQKRNSGRHAQHMKLNMPEVLLAVRSLYADNLKPFGRVLLKRLRERAAGALAQSLSRPVSEVDPEAMPRIDPRHLRNVCQTCNRLQLKPEDGHEYSVTLIGESDDFVDVCSPEDFYPPVMWQHACAYFENIPENQMMMPGGRYACARVLVQRNLPWIQGCSLGHVCHIVQLAISQKRILGYLNGHLVPYWASQERVKERCAVNKQPVSVRWQDNGGCLPFASWDDTRRCLRELLFNGCGPEPGVISLSSIKRLFRVRFNLELSETALGYSRLFDLLKDPRLANECFVQTHGAGHIIIKRPLRYPNDAPSRLSRSTQEFVDDHTHMAAPPHSPRARTSLCCLSTVPNTVPNPVPPPPPPPAMVPPRQSDAICTLPSWQAWQELQGPPGHFEPSPSFRPPGTFELPGFEPSCGHGEQMTVYDSPKGGGHGGGLFDMQYEAFEPTMGYDCMPNSMEYCGIYEETLEQPLEYDLPCPRISQCAPIKDFAPISTKLNCGKAALTSLLSPGASPRDESRTPWCTPVGNIIELIDDLKTSPETSDDAIQTSCSVSLSESTVSVDGTPENSRWLGDETECSETCHKRSLSDKSVDDGSWGSALSSLLALPLAAVIAGPAVKNTFIDISPEEMVADASPASHRSYSVPRDFESPKGDACSNIYGWIPFRRPRVSGTETSR